MWLQMNFVLQLQMELQLSFFFASVVATTFLVANMVSIKTCDCSRDFFLVATIRISPIASVIATDIYPVVTMVVTEILSSCNKSHVPPPAA
jgi:hypothetical protein